MSLERLCLICIVRIIRHLRQLGGFGPQTPCMSTVEWASNRTASRDAESSLFFRVGRIILSILMFNPDYSTGFSSVPMPSMMTSNRSPLLSGPMPEGVPVAMTSPGKSVITEDMKDTSSSTENMS